MSVALLDVNVLVALFDPIHVHHEAAHRWFIRDRKHGWATCPITLNGCIRILSGPFYPSFDATPAEVVRHLKALSAAPDHHFWPDSVTLLDETLINPGQLGGHKHITDVYLLALAVRNHGRLATFDRSIPLKAIHGAAPARLVQIPAPSR